MEIDIDNYTLTLFVTSKVEEIENGKWRHIMDEIDSTIAGYAKDVKEFLVKHKDI